MRPPGFRTVLRARPLPPSRNPGTRTGRRFAPLQPRQPKHTITDEFSNLPISRQRKYQLRKERDGHCTICGGPAVKALRCLDHLVRDRERTRKRAGYTRRYNHSFSYKMEADGAGH